MEEVVGSRFFASALGEEWKTIPSELAKKLEVLTEEKFGELITSKALSEAARCNAEKSLLEIRAEVETINGENATIKLKLEAAMSTIDELESQLSNTVAETVKLQETCNRLEKEMSDFRHQRNMAVDERDDLQKMLDRRNSEVERTQLDLNLITKQLESAISAKCEAVARSEEVAAMKVTLEYKEKRLEQERVLLNNQMESLAVDLKARTEELLNMRRDNTTRCFQLECKLSEKSQELLLATDTIKTLSDTNNNLMSKIEEMNHKTLGEKEVTAKTQDAFQHEMDAQKKLALLYQEMSEEKAELVDKLTKGYQEVKAKLDDAIEKYGDLETKHKETLLSHDEILLKKNECIAMLKKELEGASELLEDSKQDSFRKEVEGLSPSAAVASKFIKSGMSMTQIYSEFMTVSEQLATTKEENAKLDSYITTIIRELEDKSPILAKQREDYEKALDTISDLTKHNDELLNEMHLVRESNSEAKRSEGVALRENGRLKKELQDLGRQVCHLLREVEQCRAGGSSSTSTDQDLSDSTSSADIITKRLVTFSDVGELQSNNQRLLALVRELSSKQEEAEELDVSAVAKLKNKLETMREQHSDLLEQQDRQSKMMSMLINQRDMYKNLYTQAMKGAGEDVPMQLERPYVRETRSQSPKVRDNSEMQTDDKVHELKSEIEKLNKEIQTSKDEYELYKKEKAANEKILVEQFDKSRSDFHDLMLQNTKLAAKIETSEEMFKVLKGNVSVYKNQIEKLEERNKIYSEAIVKHETSAKYLRDEAMEAQTKLSGAEVMVLNLQKENALLRDSESRLLKERESYKRESHQQNLLYTNIELIKATLERNDAECKMRLEEQLKEAHRECAALRRRLQEEQDHFRQLGDHLEKQTQNAQQRMEEEKQQADKLRTELVAVREDLVVKSSQIEELSKKLKTSLFATGIDGESKKVREIEKMLNDSQAEVESLQQKLKTAKEAVDQHFSVAQCAEKQLVEIAEQHKKLQESAEAKIKEQDTRIKQLEEQCSELQGELSVYNDGQEISNTDIKRLEKVQSATTKELEDVKRELEMSKNEIKTLQDNLETAENKYAREMMLHSNDLQTLTNVKEELVKAVDEIEEVRLERDRANIALEERKECWAKQEELFKKEKEELEHRFKDLDTQNGLLLNQLQELNTQMAVVQAQTMDNQNTSMSDVSFNRSFTEDDVKSSEQLLKIIKYLRQEKDIAVSKAEIMEAEHARIKSQYEAVSKQLEEAKTSIESDRQKSDVSLVTAAKHAEVLRKVETLNAITDSNRTLRMERDALLTQITELGARMTSLEEQVVPLQEKNHELTIKAEAMQTENVTLRGEATRWRQRANILIEKSNRTSPEDWKKLQNERESLAKQLTVERANNTQLNIDFNNLSKEKSKLDEQLRDIRKQLAVQKEELDKINEEVASLRSQVFSLGNDLQHSKNEHLKLVEDHRVLTEDTAAKDLMVNDLKNNLVQIRKIAKKYKLQCEDLSKELETLKQVNETLQNADVPAEKQEQYRQEGRLESEERIQQLEQSHVVKISELSQQVTAANEDIENLKKETENLKQTSLEKEERFKTLFKNAKDRIMTLTELNSVYKAEINQKKEEGSDKEKNEEIDKLKKEKEDILAEKQAEKERMSQELETLMQRVNQLQRQLGLQQGSKPSTSSGPSEKSTTEPPTANIKPMSGHSTNTQTQSVPIQPWRSGGEPPLASIRPMSMSSQLRTVAVLPTSQSPSVMVPPQQQVHTTGSSNIEALSSSPTSSHTDYAPATSSAGSAMLGPRQVAVPPTQSSQDTEDEDNSIQVQAAPQQQAVALVLPRVEPPNSGPTQEQGTSSSSSSNAVTTTQAGHKRPREADTDSCQSEEPKQQQPQKRIRVQQGATETFQSVSESGLEVEYQVPTSSQRDHEEDTDAVIVVESDEEGDGPDEGEGADDDPDDPDTEGYDMEGNYSEQMNFEDAECQDVEEDEAGNEVEVIEDSSEVPNQSGERQETSAQEENPEQAQSEATSSGTDGTSCVTVSQASTSVSVTMPSSRTRPVAPLTRQQQTHLLLPEDGGDDGIVPSTPTLFVPRRSDGFGEAVSSPHVPTSGRFTFNESVPPSNISNEVVPEQTLEMASIDDNSTGRSVPSTPLQASPQEAGPSAEEQPAHQNLQPDAEIPAITVSTAADEPEQAPEGSTVECMGPPSIAGTSTETTQPSEQAEEMLEGEDGVTSEGEKSLTSEEGVEEGREAEATPSTNTRSRTGTSRTPPSTSRRGPRQSGHVRGGVSRSGPTPIVWAADQRGGRQDYEQWQYHPPRGDTQDRHYSAPRGRGQQGYPPRVARRSRARVQRPYGGGGNRF